MRSLLVLLGLLVLAGGIFFWGWVDRLQPAPVHDEAERQTLIYDGGNLTPNSAAFRAWQERARKIGVNAAEESKRLEADGHKGSDLNELGIWISALSRPLREEKEAQKRYEFYQEYRIPVSVAVGAVCLLLIALGLSKPKSASMPSAEPSENGSQSIQPQP